MKIYYCKENQIVIFSSSYMFPTLHIFYSSKYRSYHITGSFLLAACFNIVKKLNGDDKAVKQWKMSSFQKINQLYYNNTKF